LKQFSLNYFDKQPPLEHFRAIGNDDGLFIVVPENRFWFATKNRSGIFYTEILFKDGDRLHHLALPN
jgi:hypothetical protein